MNHNGQNDCPLVEDLLPLYVDGCCSEESVQFVSAHLAECEHCALLYERMKKELSWDVPTDIPEKKKQAIPPLPDALRTIKKKSRRNLILAIVVTLLTVLLGTFLLSELVAIGTGSGNSVLNFAARRSVKTVLETWESEGASAASDLLNGSDQFAALKENSFSEREVALPSGVTEYCYHGQYALFTPNSYAQISIGDETYWITRHYANDLLEGSVVTTLGKTYLEGDYAAFLSAFCKTGSDFILSRETIRQFLPEAGFTKDLFILEAYDACTNVQKETEFGVKQLLKEDLPAAASIDDLFYYAAMSELMPDAVYQAYCILDAELMNAFEDRAASWRALSLDEYNAAMRNSFTAYLNGLEVQYGKPVRWSVISIFRTNDPVPCWQITCAVSFASGHREIIPFTVYKNSRAVVADIPF